MFTPMAPTDDPRAASLLDLSRAAALLWRARLWLVGGALLAGVLGFVLAQQMTPVYRAWSTLVVRPPKVVDARAVRSYSPKTYEGLVKRREALLTVMRDLGLDAPPHELTLDGFASVVEVHAEPASELLRLAVELPDADQAAEAANALAAMAVARSRDLNRADVSAHQKNLEAELAAAGRSVADRREALRAFEAEAQLRRREADLEAALQARTRLQTDAVSDQVELAQQRGRVRTLDAEAEAQPERLELDRSLLDAPEMQAAAGDRGKAAATLTVKSEEVNPVRSHLELRSAEAGAALRGLKTGIAVRQAELERLDARAAELEGSLAGARSEHARLTAAAEHAEAAVAALQKRRVEGLLLQDARAEIAVMDKAFPPREPVRPRVTLTALAAALLGFAFAAAIVLALAAQASRRTREEKARAGRSAGERELLADLPDAR